MMRITLLLVARPAAGFAGPVPFRAAACGRRRTADAHVLHRRGYGVMGLCAGRARRDRRRAVCRHGVLRRRQAATGEYHLPQGALPRIHRQYLSHAQGRARPSGSISASSGPLIRGVVGDTIRVVFRNNGDRPYSVHPHGVFYTKSSEGVPYNDGTSGGDKADDGVPPGGTHVVCMAGAGARRARDRWMAAR